eukprot:jgi/Botrbrau1/1058/Bobra.0076s0024.1
MLSTMQPVNPWANEVLPSQAYDLAQPSPDYTSDGSMTFIANMAHLKLRTGKPAGTGFPETQLEAPLQSEDPVGEMQFEDMIFGGPSHCLDAKAHSPATTPPLTPRGSEVPCTPPTAPGVGVYEGLPLSSEIICSPRVPSPRFDSNDAGIFHCTHHAGAAQQKADLSLKGLEKVGPSSFELLRVVGQGAFGKVFQVRKKDSGQVFAMKVMRKEKILEKDHCDYVKAERDVLTSIVHPYIVTLRYSFQTSSKLYLVLDFINGGHLFFQLYRQGIFSEELARLYTAEIVLAIGPSPQPWICSSGPQAGKRASGLRGPCQSN